ncbi:hypothetical protein B0H16DRAFT_746313 [Mycena metata]|uniref:Uncharacterized protein n=1 Tax=Mycena metata TaxID=1033252 RepID=A0AAD7J0W8_9AGAR|nr:hypothetical protein B0H16DRAFT_746313 [Mycena metata]
MYTGLENGRAALLTECTDLKRERDAGVTLLTRCEARLASLETQHAGCAETLAAQCTQMEELRAAPAPRAGGAWATLMSVQTENARLRALLAGGGGVEVSDRGDECEEMSADEGDDELDSTPRPPKFDVNIKELERADTDLESTKTDLCAAHTTLEASVSELASTNNDLHAANVQLEKTNKELQCTNDQLRAAHTTLETSLSEETSTNGELRTTHATLQASFSELVGTHNELRTTHKTLETSFAGLASVNDKLRAANKELKSTKARLEAVNDKLQTTHKALEVSFSELTSNNDELRDTHTTLESSSLQLTSTNTELHSTTLKHASTNALLEAANKTLRIAKEEADAAVKQLTTANAEFKAAREEQLSTHAAECAGLHVRVAELAQRVRTAEAASEEVGNERAGLLAENAHLQAENTRLGVTKVKKVHQNKTLSADAPQSIAPLPPSSSPPPLPPSSRPPALPSTPPRVPSPASSDMALSPISTSPVIIQSPTVRKPAFPFRRGAPPASPPPSSPVVATQRPKSTAQPASSLFLPSRPHPSLPRPTSAMPNTVLDSLLSSRGGPSPRKRSRAAYESEGGSTETPASKVQRQAAPGNQNFVAIPRTVCVPKPASKRAVLSTTTTSTAPAKNRVPLGVVNGGGAPSNTARKLGIGHLDLLPGKQVAFASTAPWDELVGHAISAHPEQCAELLSRARGMISARG